MPEPRPMLDIIDLSKSFGMVKATDTITVQIAAGELVGIVVANGSGKTTFTISYPTLRPCRGVASRL